MFFFQRELRRGYLRMPFGLLLICLFSAALYAPQAFSAEIPLFGEGGEPVVGYGQLVERLQPGDVVLFSGHRKFTVGEKLGCGGTTCVFAIEGAPLHALRISSEPPMPLNHATNYIDEFVDGANLLESEGVPSVHIHDFKRGEFIVVDRIQSYTRLQEFLLNPFQFPKQQRIQMEQDLLRFARATEKFSSIGDFRADQLHYVDGRGWVLADWSSNHLPAELHSGMAFDHLFRDPVSPANRLVRPLSRRSFWLRSLRMKISWAISDARQLNPISKCAVLFRAIAF